MISMYELKLGNEKLEALKFLLENTRDLATALQGLDVSGLKNETADLKETIAKATVINQNLKELREHLENNDFSTLLAAYNEAKPRLDGFSEKMNDFDEKYAKIEGAVTNLPEIKTKIEQAAQLLENALPTLTAKIDEFNEKLAQGQTKLDQTSQDFEVKYGELVTLKSELETLKGEINTLLLQGVINDTQTATTTTFSSVKIKAELDALKGQIPDTANLLTSEAAEQTYAKKTDIPDVSAKLDTATAETTYAKKIEIPNVSGFLKNEVAEQTYMKKGEIPNIEGLPTMEKIEQTFAKKDDVNLSLATKLGKNEKASDSAMLEGNAASTFVKADSVSSEATANKIVKRSEDGSIYAKAVNSEKLNLSSAVEDGALAVNSTVLFSENGSELVRKASVSKLKELVKTEVNLSEYIKKTDADNAYAPKDQTSVNQNIIQISGRALDLGQSGINFAADGANGLEITAQASATGKSGYIVVSNTSSSTTYGANCVVHGKKPQEAEIILSYFVQSPSKIHLSYTASDNSISEDLIEITQNGEKKIILSKAFTEIPATTYTQKVANSYSLEGANIKKIVNSQFNGHTKIASVLFPSVVEVGEGVFNNCPNLSYVSLPNLKTAGRWCFSKIGVKELSLPNLTTIDSYYNFTENPNLETLIIPKAVFTREARIGSSCPKLKKIVCKQGMASVIKTGLSNAGQWEMVGKIQFEEV